MIKYVASYSVISKREIIRETDKQVVYMSGGLHPCERRSSKTNSYENWFDTFDEAKEFLIDKKLKKIESLRIAKERESRELMQIRSIREH